TARGGGLAGGVRTGGAPGPPAHIRRPGAEGRSLGAHPPPRARRRGERGRPWGAPGRGAAGARRPRGPRAAVRGAPAGARAEAEAQPAAPQPRAELAVGRFHLSRLLLQAGRRDEAERLQREAAADFERLVQANPHALAYHQNLVSMLLTLVPGAAEWVAQPP